MATANNLERIGETFKRRREQLKKTVAQAASDSGMSQTTWIAIEKGRPVRGTSYVRAAEVLDWPAEAYERLLAGSDATAEPVEASPDLTRELAAVRALLESAMERLERLDADSSPSESPAVRPAPLPTP